MNGNNFIKELGAQMQALHYMGQTCSSWGTTYAMYNKATDDFLDFTRRNKLNIMECLRCIYKIDYNWSPDDKIASDLIDLIEVCDFIEAYNLITKNNTAWRYRHQLESIDIHLF